MKKTTKILIAGLIVLGIASCADDKKSSSNVTSTTETVTKTFESEIGKTTSNTITITNPFNASASVNFNTLYLNTELVLDADNTTCQISTTSNSTVTMEAGASCNIVYNFTPASLKTTKLSFNVLFNANSAVCPTPETIPTLEQIFNNQKNYEYEVYNYAVNSAGTKSPDFINIDFGEINYIANGQLYSGLPEKSFSINLTEGDTYSIGYNSYTITADNTNCSLEGNTITALKTGACKLNIGYTYNEGQQAYLNSNISITPNNSTDNTKPVYGLNITYNVKYYYNILSSSTTPEFSLNYTKGLSYGNSNGNSVGALKLENGATETFTIEGTNLDKFKVAPTPYDGCNISGNSITIPEGKPFCFYTVDFTDTNTDGNFTATLKVNNTTTYNINGSIQHVNSLLQIYCQQSSTQTNAKFLDKYIK